MMRLKIFKEMILFLVLTTIVWMLLTWALKSLKPEQSKSWIEEPSNELMDYD